MLLELEGKLDQILADEAVAELHTIQDMIRWAVSRFNEAGLYFGHGTDNAWDEAVQLILTALHLPLSIGPDIRHARLTGREREAVVALLLRRVNERIPAAYLTHRAWFAGWEFYVDERVLVPRSPFAELIAKRFRPWLQHEPQRILDLCTGSGCIAIACAHVFPEAEVDAVDLSPGALEVCEQNIQEHGLEQQVIPIQSDLFDAIPGVTYDLIVSNPPYVDAEDMASLPDEFRHEPKLGLASGADGLDLTRRLLARAADHLDDGGLLFVEVGNSCIHLDEQFPQVPFVWIEFEHGGHGIFVISKEQLLKYRHLFEQ